MSEEQAQIESVCPYEQAILKERWQFFALVGTALLTPMAAIAACAILNAPSVWIGRLGAVMAIFAYLADRKANNMTGVLKPGMMVGNTFSATRAKYLSALSWYHKLAVSLVVLGGVVWGFGDLLPVGA